MAARLSSPLPLTYGEASGAKSARIVRAGVRIAVIDAQRRCLFVQHPKKGWELPGGALDPREQPTVAALRELYEEAGLDLGADRPLETVGFVTVETDSGAHWVDILFCARLGVWEEVELKSAEFPTKWFPASLIPQLQLYSMTQQLLKQLFMASQ